MLTGEEIGRQLRGPLIYKIEEWRATLRTSGLKTRDDYQLGLTCERIDSDHVTVNISITLGPIITWSGIVLLHEGIIATTDRISKELLKRLLETEPFAQAIRDQGLTALGRLLVGE